MRTIYIGAGQKSKKKSDGSNWKIYLFLTLFLVLIGSGLKLTAPLIVENWVNQKGSSAHGFSFSIRDVDISFAKGLVVLKDVKIFNPSTKTDMLETPNLAIQVSMADLFLSQENRVSVTADKVDLILSKDFSSEMDRIKVAGEKDNNYFYMHTVVGRIGKLNIIEKKEDQSRTVIELNDVNVKVKEVSLLSINKKTEFSVSSNISEGGKLNLTGKTTEEKGSTPWTIQGSLKQVPADTFNKIAGDKLPFSFNEAQLNAEISARSDNGEVSGEISPDIKRLNLIEEKPGIPTQTIARALNDELTFTLPFTLKDDVTLQYEDTYKKLKMYRKYTVASNESTTPARASVVNEAAPKNKKSSSFWPF